MVGNKTKPTDASVDDYLAQVMPDKKRADSIVLKVMMARASGYPACMWGDSIVGFGTYHYKYESGREGDHLITGFAPRKSNFVVYIMPGFSEFSDLLDRLGKHKTSSSCLYINKLADIDLDVLEEIVQQSVDVMHLRYGGG